MCIIGMVLAMDTFRSCQVAYECRALNPFAIGITQHSSCFCFTSDIITSNRFYRYSLDQTDAFIIKIAMQIIGLGQDVVPNQ